MFSEPPWIYSFRKYFYWQLMVLLGRKGAALLSWAQSLFYTFLQDPSIYRNHFDEIASVLEASTKQVFKTVCESCFLGLLWCEFYLHVLIWCVYRCICLKIRQLEIWNEVIIFHALWVLSTRWCKISSLSEHSLFISRKGLVYSNRLVGERESQWEQVCHSNTNWVSNSLIPFWHCLLGVNVRCECSPPKTALTLDSSHQSRGSLSTSAPLATNTGFPRPPSGVHNLLDWLTELRKMLYLQLQLCYKGYNSGKPMEEVQRARS